MFVARRTKKTARSLWLFILFLFSFSVFIFQLITPTRSLVLAANSRSEMEEWLQALKTASAREFYDPGPPDQHDFLSGHHNWYATSHARPTYCNVCREALSGVTSHGLSCEICKSKAHKRCAAKAIANCKWTTLASVGKDIIEDEDGVSKAARAGAA